ncbi:hypothetical protein BOX15_Mlig017243g5, partial [Macrostomum lignano]
AFPGANQSGELALTDLDRELLRQCQQESFYRRCLPFSAALTLVTFWRHRLGHYQKFIALRYLGSIVAGNILGRVSYLGVCRRKFMDTDEEQSAVKTMLMKKQPLQQQQQQKQQQHRSSSNGQSETYLWIINARFRICLICLYHAAFAAAAAAEERPNLC